MIKEFKKLINDSNCVFNWECVGLEGLDIEMNNSIDFFKKNKLVFITHSIQKSWWENFVSQIENQNSTGVIIVDHLPYDWHRPRGCVVIDNLHSLVSRNLDSWLSCKKFLLPVQFKRKVEKIEFSFFSACGGGDKSRLIFSRLLELLAIADRALISRAEVKELCLSMETDFWTLNSSLSVSATTRRFDDQPKLKKMVHDYDPKEHNDVIGSIQKCHFALSMDNCFSWEDANGAMTEKMFYPFLTGVPCIWLANDHKKDLLQHWGFQDSSDGLFVRSPGDLYGWAAAISLLERLVMDSPASQSWQDAQGERVYKNYNSLWLLNDHLHNQQWQSWQKVKNIV